MSNKFSAILADRFDILDEKLHWRLHDGVRKLSYQGIVKTREWSELGGHNERKKEH